MIFNLTENQSYDLDFLESYQASTAGNKITFPQELSAQDIIDIEAHINEMTPEQRKLSKAISDGVNEIDSYAGNTRNRFISKGDGVMTEYDHAYSQALAYRDSGYTLNPTPKMVKSWAQHNNIGLTTDQQAADNIIATGEIGMIPALENIRDIRLQVKADIANASDLATVEAILSTGKLALDAL